MPVWTATVLKSTTDAFGAFCSNAAFACSVCTAPHAFTSKSSKACSRLTPSAASIEWFLGSTPARRGGRQTGCRTDEQRHRRPGSGSRGAAQKRPSGEPMTWWPASRSWLRMASPIPAESPMTANVLVQFPPLFISLAISSSTSAAWAMRASDLVRSTVLMRCASANSFACCCCSFLTGPF